MGHGLVFSIFMLSKYASTAATNSGLACAPHPFTPHSSPSPSPSPFTVTFTFTLTLTQASPSDGD